MVLFGKQPLKQLNATGVRKTLVLPATQDSFECIDEFREILVPDCASGHRNSKVLDREILELQAGNHREVLSISDICR